MRCSPFWKRQSITSADSRIRLPWMACVNRLATVLAAVAGGTVFATEITAPNAFGHDMVVKVCVDRKPLFVGSCRSKLPLAMVM